MTKGAQDLALATTSVARATAGREVVRAPHVVNVVTRAATS
ncbi:hypothetical protein [Cellulosimicrobium cellulans]|nr:hypothetical protein [Cellulosimicrobium cellulans]